MFKLPEHPSRRTLISEAHTRPFEALDGPQKVTHIAVLSGEHAHKAERSALHELCGQFNTPPPALDAPHFTGDFTDFRLRYERHTEFSTYTVFQPLKGRMPKDPFSPAAIEVVPEDVLGSLPGELLVAVHLALLPVGKQDELAKARALFEPEHLVGARVAGGAATLLSDFRANSDGFSRILLFDHDLSDQAMGRLVQRLLEIETYRITALLALPLAKKLGPQVTRADRSLAEVAAQMADDAAETEDQALLHRLTALAAELEHTSADSNYRFGAALSLIHISEPPRPY